MQKCRGARKAYDCINMGILSPCETASKLSPEQFKPF